MRGYSMVKLKTDWRVSASIAALSIFGAGSAMAAEVSAAAKDAGATTVEDVVVTATRRNEKLNSVPVAVQAVGGKTLNQLNVTNFDDLVQFLPNVRTASRGPGTESIYIRGLATDTPGLQIAGTAGAFPNVALYLNDAPSAMPGRNLDIYPVDLERVEVLAGPQGTLFGASALAGAVRYITNKPNVNAFKFGADVSYSGTKHGAESASGSAFVNIPVIQDKFAIRLAIFDDSKGGYINNVAGTYQLPFNGNVGVPGALPTGNPTIVRNALHSCLGVVGCTGSGFAAPTVTSETNSAFVKDNFNDSSYVGGRIQAVYKFNDQWSLEVLAMRQSLKSNGTFDFDPTISNGDALNVQLFNDNWLRDTFTETTWTLNGRLGALELLYTGSYLNHRARQQIDYSHYASIGVFAPYYNCTYPGYAHCSINTQKFLGNTQNTHFVQEVRVTTPVEKRLRATAGFYYDQNNVNDQGDWYYTSLDLGFVQHGPPPSVAPLVNNPNLRPVGDAFFNDVKRKDRQVAVYGEASFDIIPQRLIVTGGLRYYNEKASMNGFSGFASYSNPFAGRSLQTTLAGLSPATYSGVLFKGNLTFKVSDSQLLYATFSEGYRPGGFNRAPCQGSITPNSTPDQIAYCKASQAYAPDTAKNYEIGWKLGLFDHKLQFNAAAYLINWDKIQVTQFNQNLSNQTYTLNFASARVEGFEGDIAWRPIQALTINSGFSYNHTKTLAYLPKDPINLGSLVPLGGPLALSPKFQGNIRARYEVEMSSGIRPYVQASIHYVGSSISSDIANANILCGSSCGTGGVYNGVAFNSNTVVNFQPNSFNLPSYVTFDGAIGATKDNLTVEVFGENLSNRHPALFISGNDGQRRQTTLRPLTFGLRLSYRM